LFKRLDLAKFNCERLQLTFHVELSPGLADRVLTGSHHHKEGDEARLVVYGSVYHFRKLPHAIRAEVRRVDDGDECHIEVEFMRREMPQRPRSLRAVRSLAAALGEEPQEVSIECEGYFTYDENSEWKSAVEIPLPLAPMPEGAFFSHLEAIRFSKRNLDELEYSVQIRRGRAGELRHWVSLIWQGFLSEEVPQKLLEQSVELSRLLLGRRDEEEAHDS
jgi:hypothetical protein